MPGEAGRQIIMGKQADRLLIGGFAGVLFGMSILFFAQPMRTFSETENRSLQGIPKLSWSRVWSKKFSEQAESFVTDHFPLRDSWVALKSELEQLRGQRENNGIYRGEEGYLFEKFGEPDFGKAGAYADAVKRFAERNPQVSTTFLLAPTSTGVYPNLLPWKASAYPESKVNDFVGERLKGSVAYIDGFGFLKPAADGDRQIYYRTDHHWTTYGAYLAYAAYAEKMGWQPEPESAFDIRTVTDSFLGSYHTRSQFSGLKPDSIQVYAPKKPFATIVSIEDDGRTMDGLYDESFLARKDKYSYFLGGVHALVKIETDLPAGSAKLDKLLVVKDSYAHSVIPFLTRHVPEIDVIDIRYYNGDIDDYMADNGIKNVLFLFNTATFLEAGGLLGLNK